MGTLSVQTGLSSHFGHKVEKNKQIVLSSTNAKALNQTETRCPPPPINLRESSTLGTQVTAHGEELAKPQDSQLNGLSWGGHTQTTRKIKASEPWESLASERDKIGSQP